MLLLSVAQLSFSPLSSGPWPRPLALPSPRATAARSLAIRSQMFPSDLTPDDIVRARRKAMQEEAMLKAMQEGQTASTAETPAELRAAMGDIAAQFAAQEARSSSAPAPHLLRSGSCYPPVSLLPGRDPDHTHTPVLLPRTRMPTTCPAAPHPLSVRLTLTLTPAPAPAPAQGRSASREAALLELCAGLFDERLAAAEPQRAQAVLQAAASLELEAKGGPGSLQAEAEEP